MGNLVEYQYQPGADLPLAVKHQGQLSVGYQSQSGASPSCIEIGASVCYWRDAGLSWSHHRTITRSGFLRAGLALSDVAGCSFVNPGSVACMHFAASFVDPAAACSGLLSLALTLTVEATVFHSWTGSYFPSLI